MTNPAFIWLPLTEDFENRGVMDMDVDSINGGITISGYGAEVDNTDYTQPKVTYKMNSILGVDPQNFSVKRFTLSFMLWTLSGSSYSSGILRIGPMNIFFNSAAMKCHLYWGLGQSDYTQYTLCSDTNELFSSKLRLWTITVDSVDGKMLVYKNRELYKTISVTTGKNYSFVHYNQSPNVGSGSQGAHFMVRDVQLFDYVLPMRELMDLWMRPLIHWPMDDYYALNAKKNLISGNYATHGYSDNCNGILRTRKEDSDGSIYYNYRLNYTGTGNSALLAIRFPQITATVGTTYSFSIEVRVNSCSSNNYVQLRKARKVNDYEASPFDYAEKNFGKGWVRYYGTQTATTTVMLWEIFTTDMKSSGTVYSWDIDVRNVSINVLNEMSIFRANELYDTRAVYDTSGHGHNAMSSVDVYPRMDVANASRGNYQVVYSFAGTSSSYIVSDKPAKQICGCAYGMTVSIWAYKVNDMTAFARMVSCTEAGGFSFEPGSDGQLRFSVYINGTYYYVSSGLAQMPGGWHHYCATYNGTYIKFYVDAVLKNTTTLTSTGYAVRFNGTARLCVGAEATASGVTSPYFDGALSDFRYYDTALTDEEVEYLYNRPTSITENGDMLTYGSVMEATQASPDLIADWTDIYAISYSSLTDSIFFLDAYDNSIMLSMRANNMHYVAWTVPSSYVGKSAVFEFDYGTDSFSGTTAKIIAATTDSPSSVSGTDVGCQWTGDKWRHVRAEFSSLRSAVGVFCNGDFRGVGLYLKNVTLRLNIASASPSVCRGGMVKCSTISETSDFKDVQINKSGNVSVNQIKEL